MIKRVLLVVAMVGTMMSSTVWGQTNSTMLPDHVEGTSEGMKALDREVRGWRNKKVSDEVFLNMEQRILKQIDKHPEDRADGYLRLGQMHRMKHYSDVANDSLAREYYIKAAENLTRPCDEPFLNAISFFLARCYMQPGNKQSIYTAQQYFIKCIEDSPDLGSELGDLYMFGWAGTCDIFLATHLYLLGIINGSGIYAHSLEYARYVMENADKILVDHGTAGLFEDFAYTQAIDNNSRNSIFPMTLAAEMGNIAAQTYLGGMYRTDLLGVNPRESHAEAYRWLKPAADQGFMPAAYELGMLCLEYDFDPELGDIYKHEPGKHVNEADRKKVVEKVRQLMTRIAIGGYAPAMTLLVELYTNVHEEPYVTPDFLLAQYWMTVLHELGNEERYATLKKAQEILDAHPMNLTATEKRLYEISAHNMALQVMYDNIGLLEKMESLKGFEHPYRRNHSELKLGVPEDLLKEANAKSINKGTASDYLVAQAYAALYNKYVHLLQAAAQNKEEQLSGNTRRFFQTLMFKLRKKAAENKFNFVNESEWEQWDGK